MNDQNEPKAGEIIPPDFDVFECEAGDVVMLRSGGPAMTVVKVEGDIAHCIWFDTHEAVRNAQFPVVSLDVIEEDFDASGFEEGVFGDEDESSDNNDHKKKKKKKKGGSED